MSTRTLDFRFSSLAREDVKRVAVNRVRSGGSTHNVCNDIYYPLHLFPRRALNLSYLRFLQLREYDYKASFKGNTRHAAHDFFLRNSQETRDTNV